MHAFADDHGNRLPGVTKDGDIGSIGAGHSLAPFGDWRPGSGVMAVAGRTGSGDNPAVRFAMLAQGEYVGDTDHLADVLNSAVENGKTKQPKREWHATQPLSAWHYAWAMAALGGQPTDRDTQYTAPTLNAEEGHYGPVAPRAASWVNIDNGVNPSDTPMISTRNTGSDNVRPANGKGPQVQSPQHAYRGLDDQEWPSIVLFEDGHVERLDSHYWERSGFDEPTAGSDGRTGDNLFYVGDANNQGANDHNADAVMVYPTAGDASGNPTLGVINQW
ncbi:MAG: hypothetical protein AAGA57_05620 [Planctomycetota bacterium]